MFSAPQLHMDSLWGLMMGIQVHLYDAERPVIVWHFGKEWTSEDYNAAIDATIPMAKKFVYIDFLIDLTQSGPPPSNLFSMMMRRYHGAHFDNFRTAYVYGESGVYQSVLTVIRLLPFVQHRLQVLENEDEARATIEALYPVVAREILDR